MNKATYRMHSRLMRIAYTSQLSINWGCLAPSLVDEKFLQVLWNLRYTKVDILGYYALHNVSAISRKFN